MTAQILGGGQSVKSHILIVLLMGAAACSKSDKKATEGTETADAEKPATVAASDAGAATAAPTGSADGTAQKLHGILTFQQVTSMREEAGDKNIPHPFYTVAECKKLGRPGTFESAKGNGLYTYNPSTKELTFEITYSGLSGTPVMVHFRHGGDGDSGPIVQTICGRPPPGDKALGFSAPPLVSAACPTGIAGTLKGTYTVAGNAKIIPPLTADAEGKLFLAGDMYLLITTCLNQRGELRGQIMHD